MEAASVAREETAAPAETWRVMIVEDNAVVASLHRRIVDSVPYLHTEHVAPNGERALAAIKVVNPDLVILDLTMAGGDGMTFLRRLRHRGIPVDVIIVTASRGGRVVQEATHLGVIDYLVKPFSPQRLRQALAAFAVRHRTLSRTDELSQSEVDAVQTAAVSRRRRRLPPGLKEDTLSTVVTLLENTRGSLSAGEVGEAVGIARVTARRYLEHLEFVGRAERSQTMDGPGRPRNRYRIKRAR
ncbi:MAG TPA: response regulator [Solirubrobacterales bacterium]|nr:response regulator [Solirubrobacterales bacterium]